MYLFHYLEIDWNEANEEGSVCFRCRSHFDPNLIDARNCLIQRPLFLTDGQQEKEMTRSGLFFQVL